MNKKDIKSLNLQELQKETRTTILYEAPHRLLRTLRELLETLGDRKVTICRELTKKYETAFLTTLEGAIAHYEVQEPKGECVIVMEGISHRQIAEEKQKEWEEMTIREHMDVYLQQGIDKKEAMKLVAKDRGVPKRDIYQQLI